MNFVISQIIEQFGVITLNRGDKRNALSRDLIADMITALEELKEQRVRAVIIRAAAEIKVWSAGHDITELPNTKANTDPLRYSDPLESVIRTIRQYPAPIIAMIHGSCWGGACDLALNCDIIIGDPTCAFAITPAKLGIPYNPSGILHFLNRIPMNLAKEMFFSAQPIDALRAEKIGILNHLVPENELESFTYNLARQICAQSSQSISVIKEQFRLISDSYPINPETWEYIQELRRKVYQGADYCEGIEAFLQKREPRFS